MKTRPLATIFLPTYNRVNYLPTTIASALAQSEGDFEFLIMDDGSTDESASLLKEFAKNDQRIKLYSWKNRGVVAAKNFLISQATGQYLAQLESDDVWSPDHLRLSIDALEHDKRLLACFCQPDIIGADGNLLDTSTIACLPPFLPAIQWQELAAKLLCGNGLCAPTAVIRASALFAREPFALPYPYLHDYELWLRLLCRGPLHIRPVTSVCYRWHDNNMSVASGGSGAEELAIIENHLPSLVARYAFPPSVISRVKGHLALLSRMLGKDEASVNYLLEKHAIESLDLEESCELISSLYNSQQGETAAGVLSALTGLCTPIPGSHRACPGAACAGGGCTRFSVS